MNRVNIIGAGLAGCECAYILSKYNIHKNIDIDYERKEMQRMHLFCITQFQICKDTSSKLQIQ